MQLNNILKIVFSLSAFFLISQIAVCQVDTPRKIGVQARVLEQLKGSIRSVPNAKLNMIGLGEYSTDETGRFAFEAPIEEFNRHDARIVIEIKIADFDIIKPYKGMVELDTAEARINMEVLVIGRNLEDEYRTQLMELSKKLKVTERKNTLSLKRMNAMNDSLVNSIQKDAAQRAEMQKSIADLKEKVELEQETKSAQKAAFEAEIAKTEKQLEVLRSSLKSKEDELYLALEERYLRQQNIQKAITADLKDYLLRVKDVQDLLQNLDKYFKPGKYPNYAATYNSTLSAYNDILTQINENYLDYVQGIERYWDNPLLARQVEDTFEILLDQLHHPKLKPAINEVNGYIRSNKSGKASKVAHEAFHDLNPMIINLEKSVNRILGML